MRRSAIAMACLLGGCFTDPPMLEQADTEPSTSTSESTAGSSGASTRVDDCELTDVALAAIGSDVIVSVDAELGGELFDAAIDGLENAFESWGDVHWALVSGFNLPPPLTECVNCEGCASVAAVHCVLDSDPQPDPLQGLNPPDCYDCALRDDSLKSVVVVSHRSSAEDVGVPDEVDAFLQSEEVLMFAACPGCGGPGTPPLAALADERGGFGIDLSTDALTEVLTHLGAPRAACSWPAPPPPGPGELLLIVIETPALPDPEFAFPVPDRSQCGADGVTPLEFFVEGGAVVLCEDACNTLKQEPVFAVAAAQAVCPAE